MCAKGAASVRGLRAFWGFRLAELAARRCDSN